MYHTEGYVDRLTYFADGHIRSFGMELKDRSCYLWCVSPQQKEGEWQRDSLEEVLSKWFYQELVAVFAKGSVYVQKELNRLGAYLEGKGNNIKLAGGKIQLYLYWSGELFIYGKQEGRLHWHVKNGIGVAVITNGLQDKECLQAACMKNEKRDNQLFRLQRKERAGDIGEIPEKRRKREAYESDDLGKRSVEQLGNRLSIQLLKAISEQQMTCGYFFAWEDKYVI